MERRLKEYPQCYGCGAENPGGLRLALSLAGGLNEEAGHSVRLSREVENCPEAFEQANQEHGLPCPRQVLTELIDLDRLTRDGDMRLNPELLPGDVINVPRAGVFYVEGMVNKPGAYPLLQDTTVSQALATAGGTDVALAREGGTTVYRKMPDGQRRPIPVRLAKIREGRAVDFLVLEDDLIVVPLSGPKFFVDRVLGLVRVGVNTAY
ncbi:MAG: SLBB domain-containing protein [Dehalococcoidia bacterium]